MRSPLPELSRRVTLTLIVVLTALSAALVAVAAVVPDDDDGASAPAPRPPEQEAVPRPVVTKVRTQSPVGRFEQAACRVRPHTVEDPPRWFHPARNFYPPGAEAPSRADLDHLAVRDGAVVVTYGADVGRRARDALRRWAAKGIGVVVAPVGTAPLAAYTAERRLICDGVDLDQLTAFTDRHFSRPLLHDQHGEASE